MTHDINEKNNNIQLTQVLYYNPGILYWGGLFSKCSGYPVISCITLSGVVWTEFGSHVFS